MIFVVFYFLCPDGGLYPLTQKLTELILILVANGDVDLADVQGVTGDRVDLI